jgi:hypothetical protein
MRSTFKRPVRDGRQKMQKQKYKHEYWALAYAIAY